ncbi:hypothetical protein B0H14DRAFT_2562831 [Mycena olivaceomarginata]|nr:hypothetical protein B0H14DRAFT_2562831 [Mycena olivaceomarginata]
MPSESVQLYQVRVTVDVRVEGALLKRRVNSQARHQHPTEPSRLLGCALTQSHLDIVQLQRHTPHTGSVISLTVLRVYLSRDNGVVGHCSLYLNPLFPGGCAYMTSAGVTKVFTASSLVHNPLYSKYSTASPGASSPISWPLAPVVGAIPARVLVEL